MKFIIRLILLAIVGGAGYIAYDLKQEDNLSVESFSDKVSQHWDTAKDKSSKLREMSKGHYAKLKAKMKEQYDTINWTEIREKLNIDEKDFAEYQEFMAWAHTEDENSDSAPSQETPNTDATPAPETTKNKATSSESAPPPPPTKEAPKPAPPSKKDLLHEKAKTLLAEAKEINRKAIPNKPGYKQNLQKAVKAYQSAADQYEVLLKQPGLSKSEKQAYENTLANINQQIYWGKKFTTL